jgi:acetyl-CoA carboxylase biotin carboxyl carrier protein
MDTTEISAVLDWMKQTDLVEVVYKKSGKGFALGSTEAPAAIPAGSLMASRFTPVASDAVGLFQWAEPGQARRCEEGAAVAAGDRLAVVVAGSGKAKPILSPCAGRIAKIFADEGQAVEYGRPLFLIEPQG